MSPNFFDPENKKAEIFLKQSNFQKVQQEQIVQGLQCLMPKLWRRLLDKTEECSLYLVEAKNGALEIPLLKTILKMRGSTKEFYLICQGASVAMREAFSRRALQGGLKTPLIEEYQIISFEEPLYIEPRAYIAIAPYEWLDISFWKDTPREHNTLVKFRNSIHHGGAGLLIFPYELGDRLLLLEQIKSSIIAGQDVVEELVHLEIRHQAYIVETIVNIECCFQRGRFSPNEEGEQLLSYLLQVEWKSLSEQAKKNIEIKIRELRAYYQKPKMILQHLYIWIFPGTPHERIATR